MHLIEPCCTQRHWPALRSKLGTNGTALFHGYGDLSIKELLPVVLTPYSEVEIMFVSPTLPDAVAETLQYWLKRQLPKMNGKGKVNTVGHLTLVTDLREKKSPVASQWLTGNPFGERMTIINVQQQDTAILLPDIAFFGPINLTYGGHFTALATKNAGLIAEMRKNYLGLQR